MKTLLIYILNATNINALYQLNQIKIYIKMKIKCIYLILLYCIAFANANEGNNFYLQATTQIAATNFDYISTYYYNSSFEGFYNFKNSPFLVGGGLGEIYGTTDNLYENNGGTYNSHFTIPYVSMFAGLLFHPMPKINNITTFRIGYSFLGQSTCNASLGYECNPSTSSVNLMQIGFRNSTMYSFTSNIYAAFNAGLDINNFTFSPGFSINPNVSIPSRKYNNPGPNLGFSIGVSF